MRRSLIWGVIGLVLCPGAGWQARAEEEAYRLGPVAFERSGRDALMIAGGVFGVFDNQDDLVTGNLEYRFGRKLFVVGPTLGLTANEDGAIYGYLGVYTDISIGPVVISPQLAVGGYAQAGSDRDLGGTFQFREAIDAAYRFDNDVRLGLRLTHISNAGIYDVNPGVQELYGTLSIPLGPLF